MNDKGIQTRAFGDSGPLISSVGLGGEGVLRTYGKADEARAVILEALKQGITYFDSARAYAGSQEYYGTIWSKDPELRDRVFQASKSASRDRKVLWRTWRTPLQRWGPTGWTSGRSTT